MGIEINYKNKFSSCRMYEKKLLRKLLYPSSPLRVHKVRDARDYKIISLEHVDDVMSLTAIPSSKKGVMCWYVFCAFFSSWRRGTQYLVSQVYRLSCLLLKDELKEMKLYLDHPSFLKFVRAKEMQDFPVDQFRDLHKIRRCEVTLSSIW